ncbi:MAG: hypothetical protein EB824_00505 [Thaumarchaeota archaeon S15]|nr:MAG: hypothetical protein EB833_03225 [Thaumarchaeota archaeon S13]RNJ76632.1 MAG: hypothetical protein EB824_00505 [Thaumarchaeota archaeon S15]
MLPGTALIAMAVAAALCAPAAALAQDAGGAHRDAATDPDEAELRAATLEAHAGVTEIMHAHVAGDYSAPDYPIVMSYVDEENMEVVVMMHVMALLAGIDYDEEELLVALGTEHPDVGIEIVYGTFTPDSTWVRVESWKQYYLSNCVPEPQPQRKAACEVYAEKLRQSGASVAGLDRGVPDGAAGALAAKPAAPDPVPERAQAPHPARAADAPGPAPAATPRAAATAIPIRGGMELAVTLPDPPAGAGGHGPTAGTTGIVVGLADGSPAMLVSSHVIDAIAGGAGSPASLTLRGSGMLTPVTSEVIATTDIISHTAVSSDAAVISLDGTGIAPAVGEIQDGAATIAVSAYGGVRALIGQDAEIIGAMTRDRGAIVGDNVSIRGHVDGHDRVITRQAIAAYQAERGDSGAPITHVGDDGGHALLGIHAGTIQTYILDHDGQVVPWPRLHGYGETGAYGVFSTWENIKRDLGIP